MKQILTTLTSTLLIGLLVGLAPALTSTALAQQREPQLEPRPAQPIDLTVSPPVSYLLLKPGETNRHVVTLEQYGTIPLEMEVLVVDFQADGRTGQPNLGDLANLSATTFPHVRLEGSGLMIDSAGTGASFTLGVGERRTITLVFALPDTQVEREYPMSVLFTARPAGSVIQSGSGASVSALVGSNLIATVSRTERDRGRLQPKTIDAPTILDSLGRLNFTILAENTGLNATNASGSATITNWQGTEVARYDFYPDMILANSTRLLRTSTDGSDPLDPDIDPSLISEVFGYEAAFLLGPYTIDIELAHNGQLESAGSTRVSARVVALPYSLVMIPLIILLVWLAVQTMLNLQRRRHG